MPEADRLGERFFGKGGVTASSWRDVVHFMLRVLVSGMPSAGAGGVDQERHLRLARRAFMLITSSQAPLSVHAGLLLGHFGGDAVDFLCYFWDSPAGDGTDSAAGPGAAPQLHHSVCTQYHSLYFAALWFEAAAARGSADVSAAIGAAMKALPLLLSALLCHHKVPPLFSSVCHKPPPLVLKCDYKTHTYVHSLLSFVTTGWTPYGLVICAAGLRTTRRCYTLPSSLSLPVINVGCV